MADAENRSIIFVKTLVFGPLFVLRVIRSRSVPNDRRKLPQIVKIIPRAQGKERIFRTPFARRMMVCNVFWIYCPNRSF